MPPPLSPLGMCFFSSRELRGHTWKPSAQGNPCTSQGPGVNGGVSPIDTSCYQSATATRTQDSNRETGCASAVLAFVQSHPDTLAGHGPLLQVYTTSSITDITDLPRALFSRMGQGLVMAPGFLGDTQGTSNQPWVCWVFPTF